MTGDLPVPFILEGCPSPEWEAWTGFEQTRWREKRPFQALGLVLKRLARLESLEEVETVRMGRWNEQNIGNL